MSSEYGMNKSMTFNEDNFKNLSIGDSIDWFGFENRVRQLIHVILEPTTKRIVDTKDLVEKMNIQNEFLRRRI